MFLQPLTDNEKNAHNSKWNGDGGDNTKAHQNGLVHIIVQHKYKRTKSNTDDYKYNSPDEFPLPGDQQ